MRDRVCWECSGHHREKNHVELIEMSSPKSNPADGAPPENSSTKKPFAKKSQRRDSRSPRDSKPPVEGKSTIETSRRKPAIKAAIKAPEKLKAPEKRQTNAETTTGAKVEGKKHPFLPMTKKPPELVRLQKVLAQSGVASRRHSEEIILAGRVKVDGVVMMELGTKVNPLVQKVFVDDEPIHSERKIYYLVNKPVGHISTNDDPAGRPRVIDLLPKTKERLYPVGRLDEASQGLMLVTNDGPLANKLLHPRYGVPKTYRVQVAGSPDWKALESLNLGQEFSEGTFKVDSFKLLREQGESTFLEIVLKEGHNREIRRLFARIGHKVLKLQRVAFGPLRIAKLGIGDYRHLTTFEVRQLKQVAAGQKATGDDSTSGEIPKKKKAFRHSAPGKHRTPGKKHS